MFYFDFRMSETYCLKWSNFQSNVSKSFSLLRNEKQLSDVTLISDDHKMVTAHKIVLSTCSEYFKDILTKTKLQNMTFCLEGVSHNDLNRVLDYIYYGEIQVYQDYLERFLNLARRFKLDGLTVGNNVEPEFRSKESEITPSMIDPPSEPLLTKDEKVDTSNLPELIDGRVIENKGQNKTNQTDDCDKQEDTIQEVQDVEWYFLKTRTKKSTTGPGVLITHSDKYKFHENHPFHAKFDGKRSFWWSCSEKKRTGCRATAVMKKKTVPGKNGEEDKIDYKLVKVSPEDSHLLYHGPIYHKIQAEKIMIKLKLMATDDMFEKISSIQRRGLEEELWSKYSEDEAKLIRANMPDKIYNTLNNTRINLRDKHLKSFEGSWEEES